MELIWIIYWIFLVISFIMGIIMIILKYRITGILETLLSVTLPFMTMIFMFHRDWVNGTESEFEFLLAQLQNGSFKAIMLVLLYMVLIGLFIYHIFILYKKIVLNKKNV